MADIVYPTTIKTDYDKLVAVYSLIEQMRLEHNRQGEIARSNWDKYKGKWYEYAHRPASLGGSAFWNKVLPLLREQNRLKGNIRGAIYTDEQWKALSEDDRDAAILELYGDKAVERDKATKATSPLLDELKTISLDSLDGETPPDPLEDWTTYTEVDPSGYLTVAANQVTITDMPRNQSTFLYDDKGAGHFGTTFSSPHLLSSEYGNIDNAAEIIIWGLTNTTNFSFYTDDVFFLIWEDYASQRLRLFMDDGGVDDWDDSNVCSADTQYWFTINRDDPTTCAIYSDSDRTNLLDTLSVSQGTDSFRYMISAASRGGSGSGASNAVVYDLDLQEGGGITEKASSDSGAGVDVAMARNIHSGDVGSGVESSSLDTTGVVNKFGSDTAAGVDIAGTAVIWVVFDSGSGVEVSIVSPVFFVGDTGVGVELGVLNKDAYASDTGNGEDILKALGAGGKSTDMRLFGSLGKAGIPSRQARIPSEGVNI
jgi:hypothetical protein